MRRSNAARPADRRREQEYQRAIAAGGDVAAEAKWQRLYVQTLDATQGRFGLCQWSLDDGNPGACTSRTGDVYCHIHNRQLEREIERRRKAQESEDRAAVPVQPAAPRVRRMPTKHSSSGWAAYKTKHPERAAFYASSTWRVMRDRHLKATPTCVVCGQKASHADHVVSIALGGSQDGQLQSMCAKHHNEKTVRDSHEAAKRAAAFRRRGGVVISRKE